MENSLCDEVLINEFYAAPASSLIERLPEPEVLSSDRENKKMGIGTISFTGIVVAYAAFEKLAEDYELADRLMDYIGTLF